MKSEKLKHLIALLAFAFTGAIQAQNTMFIKETSGAITSYQLTGISKLTFQLGNMIVKQNNGSTTPFALNNISNYHFKNLPIGFSTIKDEEITKLFMFPNPGNNEVHLNYEAQEIRTVKIDIIDAKGSVIQQQVEKSQKGKNQVIVNVSKLAQGLYLFRLHNGYDVETINFLRN